MTSKVFGFLEKAKHSSVFSQTAPSCGVKALKSPCGVNQKNLNSSRARLLCGRLTGCPHRFVPSVWDKAQSQSQSPPYRLCLDLPGIADGAALVLMFVFDVFGIATLPVWCRFGVLQNLATNFANSFTLSLVGVASSKHEGSSKPHGGSWKTK